MYEEGIEMLSPLHLRFTINNWENEYYGSKKIADFQFHGGHFKIVYTHNVLDGEEYRRLLLSQLSGKYRQPIDAFLQVESGGRGRIVTDLSAHRHIIENSYYRRWSIVLWKMQEVKIQQAVPDFKNHALTWIIVLKTGISKADVSAASQTKCSIPVCFQMSCIESLSADFAQLMARGSDHDMVFKCAGQSIGAHEAVVCARSPVIAAMLSSDMVEGRTRVITVQGIEPDVFKHFLRYLYCGKLDELTCDVTLTLYEFGDQYAVLGLVKRCSQFLLEHLSPKNACDLLVISDLHSDEDFAEKIITYMVEAAVPHVSDRWSAFRKNHPKLAVKVLPEKELVEEKKLKCSKRKLYFCCEKMRMRKK